MYYQPTPADIALDTHTEECFIAPSGRPYFSPVQVQAAYLNMIYDAKTMDNPEKAMAMERDAASDPDAFSDEEIDEDDFVDEIEVVDLTENRAIEVIDLTEDRNPLATPAPAALAVPAVPLPAPVAVPAVPLPAVPLALQSMHCLFPEQSLFDWQTSGPNRYNGASSSSPFCQHRKRHNNSQSW
jgi:hypothetical protein